MPRLRPKILLLGGSAEAYALADILGARGDLDILTSFAGATRERRAPRGPFRVGGFGGAAGLARFLAAAGTDAVIDATHPFARAMSANAAEACRAAGVPLVHVVRPGWVQGEGDFWIEAEDMAAAAQAIPLGAGPVFLTVGRTELAPFAARPDLRFLARVIDPPEEETGIAALELVLARGPFGFEAERDFLRERDIGCIVAKNSGGGRAKLDAARALGLPVVMVRRPAPPEGTCVPDAAAAAAWLDGLAPHGGAA